MVALDSDEAFLERAGDRRPARDERGWASRGVDRAAAKRAGAQPPYGYVISFIRFHARGFATPASRFMCALCYNYGVELRNFMPNAISQAATFIGVCEGFLGIRLLCPEIRDGAHLHPLGELVDSGQKVGVAPGRVSQGPDDVQSPHGERPCDGDGL
jgi:hypothetical protein